MKKHTPGPWSPAFYTVTPEMLERFTVGSVHHAVAVNDRPQEPNGLLVALCGDEDGLDSQSAADARLIAAAPEMLEALQGVLDQIGDCFRDVWRNNDHDTEHYCPICNELNGHHDDSCSIPSVIAAIKKARGEK